MFDCFLSAWMEAVVSHAGKSPFTAPELIWKYLLLWRPRHAQNWTVLPAWYVYLICYTNKNAAGFTTFIYLLIFCWEYFFYSAHFFSALNTISIHLSPHYRQRMKLASYFWQNISWLTAQQMRNHLPGAKQPSALGKDAACLWGESVFKWL